MCVFQRAKEPCGQAPTKPLLPGENNHITAAQKKVSRAEDRAAISRHRPQHTSQSQHRHHKPVIHKPPRPVNDITETKPRKKGKEILDEKRGGEAAPPATPRSTDPLFPTRKQLDMEDQTVD